MRHWFQDPLSTNKMLNTVRRARPPLLALLLLSLRETEGCYPLSPWLREVTEEGCVGLWGLNCPGPPHHTHTTSPRTPFQLRSGSSGLIWAACSWIIVQIFWIDLGPNSWPCLFLMMARLSMGPVAVTTPLGCCGTALPGLWPPFAPGLHDPWRLMPFFTSPLLKPHHSNPIHCQHIALPAVIAQGQPEYQVKWILGML